MPDIEPQKKNVRHRDLSQTQIQAGSEPSPASEGKAGVGPKLLAENGPRSIGTGSDLMAEDTYRDLADRYDWMKRENPAREAFFRELFATYGVKTVLDCACGTGWDLVLFHSLGCDVQGSDLSGAMLAQAERRLSESNLQIPLRQADFRHLPDHYLTKFDAVVCLSNSINELLVEKDTLQALLSMIAVLRDGGILVLDQGQSDASMQDPPRFAPIVNERDFSRLFVMDYAQDVMHVHIFDFLHTEHARDFRHTSVRIRIRLQDDWERILRQAGFTATAYFGDWQGTPYDKGHSQRLIAVAQK
jgi:glycine/sarcosine N-methyltransferase